MTSIHEVVVATISELGMPAPTDIIQTMLMKDRYFVGWKFRYDGGHAILQAGSNVIEFYDEQGKLLKTIAVCSATITLSLERQLEFPSKYQRCGGPFGGA